MPREIRAALIHQGNGAITVIIYYNGLLDSVNGAGYYLVIALCHLTAGL